MKCLRGLVRAVISVVSIAAVVTLAPLALGAETTSATLSATYVAESHSVSLTGAGFPPGSTVSFKGTFGTATVNGTAPAKSDSGFSFVMAVPPGYAGPATISATATRPRLGGLLGTQTTKSTAQPTTAPTPATTPTPPVTPTSASASASASDAANTVLPARILGDYWTTWSGFPISELATQAPGYNLHYYSFANSASPGTGKVAVESDAVAADIATSRASGAIWILSVGGEGDGGIALSTEANVDEMVNSLIPIVTTFGFQGVDWDLETAPGKYTNEAIVSASKKLKARFGNDFVIQFTAMVSDTQRVELVAENPDAIDLLGFMFYCDPIFVAPDSTIANITSTVNDAVAAGVPASKILIGAMVGSNEPHSTPEAYVTAYSNLVKTHPDLRGMFHWETKLDQDAGWAFVNLASPALYQV